MKCRYFIDIVGVGRLEPRHQSQEEMFGTIKFRTNRLGAECRGRVLLSRRRGQWGEEKSLNVVGCFNISIPVATL